MLFLELNSISFVMPHSTFCLVEVVASDQTFHLFPRDPDLEGHHAESAILESQDSVFDGISVDLYVIDLYLRDMWVQWSLYIYSFTTLSSTFNHFQVSSNSPSLLVIHKSSFFVANPGMSSSSP